jgi:hypothetical protein
MVAAANAEAWAYVDHLNSQTFGTLARTASGVSRLTGGVRNLAPGAPPVADAALRQ